MSSEISTRDDVDEIIKETGTSLEAKCKGTYGTQLTQPAPVELRSANRAKIVCTATGIKKTLVAGRVYVALVDLGEHLRILMTYEQQHKVLSSILVLYTTVLPRFYSKIITLAGGSHYRTVKSIDFERALGCVMRSYMQITEPQAGSFNAVDSTAFPGDGTKGTTTAFGTAWKQSV